MKISIVSPVYQAEKIIPELVSRTENELKKLNCEYEIILVEDHSPDNSWREIETTCRRNKSVIGLKLSRNYGQHYAITAGLIEASGNYIVVMDCDLQDDPAYIADMLRLAESGFDIIYTSKENRAHGRIKNLLALAYFKVIAFLSNQPENSHQVGAYSLITKKVRDAFILYGERHRHYLPILRSLGFKSTHLQIQHYPRFEGKTSYSLSKLIRHGVDGIVSQSTLLLYFSIYIGFSFFVFSLIGIAYYIYNYFANTVLPGYTSLIIVILFSTGLILISLGIMGLYISKIFEQVRQRPLFIIETKLNSKEQNER